MINFEKDVNIDIKDDALKEISELSQKLVDLDEESAMREGGGIEFCIEIFGCSWI